MSRISRCIFEDAVRCLLQHANTFRAILWLFDILLGAAEALTTSKANLFSVGVCRQQLHQRLSLHVETTRISTHLRRVSQQVDLRLQ